MLPAYYEFQNAVKICSGLLALDRLSYELHSLHAKAPLVLSDATLRKLGLLDHVLSAMPDITPACVYTDIPADSGVSVVDHIAQLYRENECDSIVAAGGGSVLDTAKGVALLIAQGASHIKSLMGCDTLDRGHRVPYIAIPTTAGTGSEVTAVAVVSDPVHQVKLEYISTHLMPDVAILDVRMTQSLPPRITASTGMDALCHAIEAFSSTQNNPLSDAYAIASIRLIMENLEKAVRHPHDKQARLAMANASLLAGSAFSNSMVGGVHAIGHATGGLCHVAHGDAMAILLPYVMRFNEDCLQDIYSELLLYLGGPELYSQTAPARRAREAIHCVRRLAKRLNQISGLPLRLQDTGRVKAEDLPLIAEAAVNDGAMIANRKAITQKDALKILMHAY